MPKIVYTIDTNYHSILNPVKVQNMSDGTQGTQTVVSGLMTYSF
jgi:hypothetical protein